MILKRLGTVIFTVAMMTGAGYGMDRAPKVIEVIEHKPEAVYEEDDFIRIRRAQYSNGNGPNVREFLYFSRWHEYLDELAEEKLREREYENSLRQYEKEKERVDRTNQRIRQQNEYTGNINVPQGNSVDISRIQNTGDTGGN